MSLTVVYFIPFCTVQKGQNSRSGGKEGPMRLNNILVVLAATFFFPVYAGEHHLRTMEEEAAHVRHLIEGDEEERHFGVAAEHERGHKAPILRNASFLQIREGACELAERQTLELDFEYDITEAVSLGAWYSKELDTPHDIIHDEWWGVRAKIWW